jgi:hypothetical protein
MVTEVKVQYVTISRQVSLLVDLEYSNIVLIGTVYISTKYCRQMVPLETYFCFWATWWIHL